MTKKANQPRPKLFVGSSSESKDVAYAIQDNLEQDAETTVWAQGVFVPSKTAIDSLARTLAASDFGAFVFAPDDAVRLRRKIYSSVRDNVILELGLFVGKLGMERTFIVMPRNLANLRIPTDLTGITPGYYDAERDDNNLQAALGPVCNQIRKVIKSLKTLKRPAKKKAKKSASRGPVIREARYGTASRWVDVKQPLKKQVQRGKRRIHIGKELGGDPAPGKEKKLRLKFSHGGHEYNIILPEGRDLEFPQ
jgi:predicted nucleotide-binding protein with TIR-like domain/DnaJ-like protein